MTAEERIQIRGPFISFVSEPGYDAFRVAARVGFKETENPHARQTFSYDEVKMLEKMMTAQGVEVVIVRWE